eukprot:3941464-Rhodomonas_salina.1
MQYGESLAAQYCGRRIAYRCLTLSRRLISSSFSSVARSFSATFATGTPAGRRSVPRALYQARRTIAEFCTRVHAATRPDQLHTAQAEHAPCLV